jgi:hypothetical protein
LHFKILPFMFVPKSGTDESTNIRQFPGPAAQSATIQSLENTAFIFRQTYRESFLVSKKTIKHSGPKNKKT